MLIYTVFEGSREGLRLGGAHTPVPPPSGSAPAVKSCSFRLLYQKFNVSPATGRRIEAGESMHRPINGANLKTLDISQGSVATRWRCREIFSDSFIVKHILISTGNYFEIG